MEQHKVPSNASTERMPGNLEETQAVTQSAVREGQEDSSILHDTVEPDNELEGQHNKDIRSGTNEEYIQNDVNTLKEKE